VKVADRIGVLSAVGALVESHRPAAHPLARFGNHLRGGPDVGFGKAGQLRDPTGAVVGEERRHHLPTVGVCGDEIGVDGAVFDQQV
jgi:hypothetical protein